MAIEKILNTRVVLKHDSLENWNKETAIILKKGEAALAEVTVNKQDPISGELVKVPTYLIKIGDGTKKFSELNWVAAPAADVYDWAKAANKPTYAANEITGISDYIAEYVENEMGISIDTDTQYQIVKVDDYNYKLQSKGKGDSAWADVTDSTIVIPKVEKSNTNGNIKFNGNDIEVYRPTDLTMTESKADDTTYGGVVIDSIKQENGKVSVTRRALTAADVPVLSWDKITASEGDSLTEYLDFHDTRISTLESSKVDAEDFNQLVDDIGSVPNGYDEASDTYKWENLVEYIDYQNDAQDTAIEANANAIAALQTAQAGGLVRKIVTELPDVATAKDNTIYMIKRAAGLDGNDVYDEYIIVTVTNDDNTATKKFELLGNTELDLSNYYDKDYINTTYTTKSDFNELFRDGADLMVNLANYANKAECDANGNIIVDTYETKEDASAKLEEAKGYTDALANGQVKTNKEAIEAINHAETGILAQAKADSADKAAVVLSEAQKYADGLATNYATAEQGQKADSALQEVVANDLTDKPSGIKVTEKNKIEVDDTIVWVFDCGDSTTE